MQLFSGLASPILVWLLQTPHLPRFARMSLFLGGGSNEFEPPPTKTATLRGRVNFGVGSFKWFFCSFFRIGFAHPRVVTPNTSSASLRSDVYFSWLSFQTSLKLNQKKQPPFGAAAVFVVEKGFEPP